LHPERYDYDVDESLSARKSDTFQVQKPSAKQRQLQRMVVLFQMVYVGPPMIYYGSEAGMWGGDDPCNRMPMIWPEKTYEPQVGDPRGRLRQPDTVEFDRSLHDYYRMACHLRRQNPTLQHGAMETLLTDDQAQVVVMRRWDDERSLYVIMNRGDHPYVWQLRDAGDEPLVQIFTASRGNDKVEIPTTDEEISVSVPSCEGVVLLQEH